MKHTRTIQKYPGATPELVEDIGNLYYDALAEFLQLLADKVRHDAQADEERGRVQLAAELRACSDQLNQSAAHIVRAWKICERHVRT